MAAQAHEINQFPSPGALVSQARQRVAAELEQAPQLHPRLPWGWLRTPGRLETLSPGAITRVVRMLMHAHERALAGELFVVVLERIEGKNRRWAARVISGDDAMWQDESTRLREDLRQDLTLPLGAAGVARR